MGFALGNLFKMALGGKQKEDARGVVCKKNCICAARSPLQYWYRLTTYVGFQRTLLFSELKRVAEPVPTALKVIFILTRNFYLPRHRSNIGNPPEMKLSQNRSPRFLLLRCLGSPVRQLVAHRWLGGHGILCPPHAASSSEAG